jgi:plastocyanin
MSSRQFGLPAAAVAASLLLLVVFGFASRRTDSPVLTATVGANDAFTIALADASGAPVKHLDAGTYTLVVHDLSTIHNFHLFGPGGVDVASSVAAAGDSTFTVTLTDGTYTFQCDPHAAGGMQGVFAVGTAMLPPPPPQRLTAHVGPRSSIGVGGAIALVPGPAVLTVSDRSRRDDFHLVGPGVNKATGVRFRGTVTWKVTLAAATYVFRSDRHRTLHGSFVVGSGATSSGGYGGHGG